MWLTYHVSEGAEQRRVSLSKSRRASLGHVVDALLQLQQTAEQKEDDEDRVGQRRLELSHERLKEKDFRITPRSEFAV